MNSALFVLNLTEIPLLDSFLRTKTSNEIAEIQIVALGADIELALQDKKIAYISGDGLRSVSHFDCFKNAEEMGREVLLDPSLSFFSYRNVPIAEVLLPSLQIYLLSVFYFLDVFTSFFEKTPDCKQIILLPNAGRISELGGVLDEIGIRVALDSAYAVSIQHGVTVTVANIESAAVRYQLLWKTTQFRLKRWAFGIALSILNSTISALLTPKPIRILASDYWKHLDPLIQDFPESELVLLDRAEVTKIDWVRIWKHRMRFVHIENFLSVPEIERAAKLGRDFAHQWEQSKDNNFPLKKASFRGHSIEPFLKRALPLLLGRGGKRAVLQIDGTFALYKHMKPNVVLVRASFSVQMHFPILCHVAKQLGIPSIELQHGLLYLGPGTFIHKPAPEYIATYGPLTSAGFKKYGYSNDKLLNIGSPRFDEYKTMRERPLSAVRPFTIAFIIPAVLPQSWSDTYEVREYIRGIARATAAIPNAVALCKLRPQESDGEFYRKVIAAAFGDTPFRIEQYKSLVDAIAESDVVVTIYSTTVLEGLISGRPLVYNGSLEYHRVLANEFLPYAQAGAMAITITQEELKQTLTALAADEDLRKVFVKNADAFMRENYSFDGNASERLAGKIRKLVKPPQMQ